MDPSLKAGPKQRVAKPSLPGLPPHPQRFIGTVPTMSVRKRDTTTSAVQRPTSPRPIGSYPGVSIPFPQIFENSSLGKEKGGGVSDKNEEKQSMCLIWWTAPQ